MVAVDASVKLLKKHFSTVSSNTAFLKKLGLLAGAGLSIKAIKKAIDTYKKVHPVKHDRHEQKISGRSLPFHNGDNDTVAGKSVALIKVPVKQKISGQHLSLHSGDNDDGIVGEPVELVKVPVKAEKIVKLPVKNTKWARLGAGLLAFTYFLTKKNDESQVLVSDQALIPGIATPYGTISSYNAALEYQNLPNVTIPFNQIEFSKLPSYMVEQIDWSEKLLSDANEAALLKRIDKKNAERKRQKEYLEKKEYFEKNNELIREKFDEKIDTLKKYNELIKKKLNKEMFDKEINILKKYFEKNDELIRENKKLIWSPDGSLNKNVESLNALEKNNILYEFKIAHCKELIEKNKNNNQIVEELDKIIKNYEKEINVNEKIIHEINISFSKEKTDSPYVIFEPKTSEIPESFINDDDIKLIAPGAIGIGVGAYLIGKNFKDEKKKKNLLQKKDNLVTPGPEGFPYKNEEEFFLSNTSDVFGRKIKALRKEFEGPLNQLKEIKNSLRAFDEEELSIELKSFIEEKKFQYEDAEKKFYLNNIKDFDDEGKKIILGVEDTKEGDRFAQAQGLLDEKMSHYMAAKLKNREQLVVYDELGKILALVHYKVMTKKDNKDNPLLENIYRNLKSDNKNYSFCKLELVLLNKEIKILDVLPFLLNGICAITKTDFVVMMIDKDHYEHSSNKNVFELNTISNGSGKNYQLIAFDLQKTKKYFFKNKLQLFIEEKKFQYEDGEEKFYLNNIKDFNEEEIKIIEGVKDTKEGDSFAQAQGLLDKKMSRYMAAKSKNHECLVLYNNAGEILGLIHCEVMNNYLVNYLIENPLSEEIPNILITPSLSNNFFCKIELIALCEENKIPDFSAIAKGICEITKQHNIIMLVNKSYNGVFLEKIEKFKINTNILVENKYHLYGFKVKILTPFENGTIKYNVLPVSPKKIVNYENSNYLLK